MKFSSILLISVALAAVANAAPLSVKGAVKIDTARHGINVALAPMISKRCNDCTNQDGVALDLIVKTSADHYSEIAHARLDDLMKEIQTAKVTSGTEDMPKEKNLLTVTVQAQIDEAKKACSPEALQPVIMATVTADSNFDIPWSKKEEVEKKMIELDIAITKAVLDRIQATVNAEQLSKDCTENMTNTEIVPAPAAPAPAETPAPTAVESAPETPAVAPETPAPDVSAPAPTVVEVPATASEPSEESPKEENGLQAGIDVAASVDNKFVCKTGCKDSEDAHTVLSLRVNLENEFKPRLDHFYDQEVPTAYTERRKSLLDGVLDILSHLRVDVNADVKNNSK